MVKEAEWWMKEIIEERNCWMSEKVKENVASVREQKELKTEVNS